MHIKASFLSCTGPINISVEWKWVLPEVSAILATMESVGLVLLLGWVSGHLFPGLCPYLVGSSSYSCQWLPSFSQDSPNVQMMGSSYSPVDFLCQPSQTQTSVFCPHAPLMLPICPPL